MLGRWGSSLLWMVCVRMRDDGGCLLASSTGLLSASLLACMWHAMHACICTRKKRPGFAKQVNCSLADLNGRGGTGMDDLSISVTVEI